MDKGAHFYKCDFQVHTPRDINWQGDRAVTQETRKTYAEDFIKKCRFLGLSAVAITDHHDFSFYATIRAAAENEIDENGFSISPDKRIIVFPGVELTFSTPPCQALLIMDSDYPLNNLNQILHLFGITPNPPEDATTVITVPITNTIVNGFVELYEKLDTIESLRGRFIVLPNLSEGGRHTLLRAGNSEHYKKMPCVGGYLDGSIIQYGVGNTNIVNGIAREWGYKSVAIFQTSDNRQRDFGVLGTHSTWVKWATPTAEALRQACLAKESRLSLVHPDLPQTFITKIDVTNSKFLGSFSVELNQQYNALIGGRGTGKSTILEYLRWGLCDQTSVVMSEDQNELENRRQGLIDKTLIPFGGEVRVTFSLNGISHTVKRNSVSKEIVMKIADGEFEKVKEEEVRRILPIQAYSQKQLSSVGIRTEELKRFIQTPIATELNALQYQISDVGKKIKSNYNDVVRLKQVQNEIDQLSLEVRSLNNQVENLRKSLTGISAEDQVIISKKQLFDNEQSLIVKAQTEITIARNKITDLAVSLQRYPELSGTDSNTVNSSLIASLNSARIKKFEELKGLGTQLQDSLKDDSMLEFTNLVAEWQRVKREFEIQYENAKAKASSNQTQLNAIKQIEARLKNLESSMNERTLFVKELGYSGEEFDRQQAEWFGLHKTKIDLLNAQALKFSELSNGLIKAEIIKSIDVRQIKSLLSLAFQGTRINETKTQALCESILNGDDPLEKWKLLLNELKSLAELRISEDKKVELPSTPILIENDFNEGNRMRIVEALTPEKWLAMATTEIDFNTEFNYQTNSQMGDVIPFAEASAGQQATALLTVLLNQPGMPLIIDQPEDDIDNKAIEDIIKSIWKSKTKRQLIFTSHNANLVVNGDAELVICCDYRESGSQTRGIIKAEGAIDFKVIREEITSVMEGGEKAFKLRKNKYGF